MNSAHAYGDCAQNMKNRTLKSTANNPESSRGFSLLIIEVQNEKNNKKYYKTVLDSPGLETLVNDINPINIDSKKELLYNIHSFLVLTD